LYSKTSALNTGILGFMQITLVAHDIRSTHNVGAFFRTCDGLGVKRIIFSGYTPHPTFEGDSRLPHFADKITRQIHKTALGAESTVDFERFETLEEVLGQLKSENTALVALEQFPGSVSPAQCAETLAKKFKNRPVALILGNEIHGVKDEILQQMDLVMEIPMHGIKESFNVSVAAGIALYALTNS
jgi:23S rRNA (guanosine2251-2'-O)-methyltransferase